MAFRNQPDLHNMMLYPFFAEGLDAAQQNWRDVVATATQAGIPVPALSASLAYYDSFRSANLPQNLTQAQRDFFGAHTYQRADQLELGFIHTEWSSLIKTKVEHT